MAQSEQIDELNERIKELKCLYDISTLASDSSLNMKQKLQAIADRISHAWRYTSEAVAEIRVGNDHFVSGTLLEPSVFISEPFYFDAVKVGFVRVHYPSPKRTAADFLKYEHLLLRKLAEEVSTLYERYKRQEREELLQRSMERNDRLAILGELTAGIAHELNTPLGNILGYAEFIAEGEGLPQMKKDASKIIRSAIHAREVVKKLMFFSCEMPEKNETVDVNQVVESSLDLLQPTLKSKRIELDLLLEENLPSIVIDSIQLTQVIFNLIINSIHASDADSRIEVSTTFKSNWLQLTVKDNGMGIPEDIRDKVFEPFFTTKEVGEGSGLGLSVVYGIVRKHGGHIHFTSELDNGTTFVVNLPLAP